MREPTGNEEGLRKCFLSCPPGSGRLATALPGALKNNATTCANTGACVGVAGHTGHKIN